MNRFSTYFTMIILIDANAHPRDVIGRVFHTVKSAGGRMFIDANIIAQTPAKKRPVSVEVIGSGTVQEVECLDLTVAGAKLCGVRIEVSSAASCDNQGTVLLLESSSVLVTWSEFVMLAWNAKVSHLLSHVPCSGEELPLW